MRMLKPASRMAAICMGIALLAGILCFAASQVLRVDEPLFYKVYGAYPVSIYANEEGTGEEVTDGEAEKEEDSSEEDADKEYMVLDEKLFFLPYLACMEGKVRQVNDIHFREAPFLYTSQRSTALHNSGKSNFFITESFSMVLDEWTEDAASALAKPITLTSAEVVYNDGEKETVELGEILLYEDRPEEPELLEITDMSDEGDADSGDGRNRNVVIACPQKNVKLLSVACVPEPAGGEVTVNKRTADEIKDMTVKKGESLTFEATLEKKEVGVIKEPALQVIYETEDGKKHTQFLEHFSQGTDVKPNFWQALRMLRKGEALK